MQYQLTHPSTSSVSSNKELTDFQLFKKQSPTIHHQMLNM